MSFDRHSFLAGAGSSLAVLTSGSVASAAPGPDSPAETKEGALARLMAGNARFAADKPLCPPLSSRRLELSQGQQPFAIVLGCSDSRVPVETIFDQMPGSIFVVRVAGNFVDDEGLGSIEYSVAVLKSSLMLVLGHTGCGAVNAAIDYVKDGKTQPGHIQKLVTAIAPAARATKSMSGEWIDNAVVRNVNDNVAALTARSEIVADAVKSGSLALAGGVYDLHSGKVSILH